jgi:hypothetical protein
MVLARRYREISHALHPKLVPDRFQVTAFVELNFVGDDAGAKALVERVLQVPACLIPLNELADNLSLALSASIVVEGSPDLQVLRGIALLVLCRPLPGDDVGTQR